MATLFPDEPEPTIVLHFPRQVYSMFLQGTVCSKLELPMGLATPSCPLHSLLDCTVVAFPQVKRNSLPRALNHTWRLLQLRRVQAHHHTCHTPSHPSHTITYHHTRSHSITQHGFLPATPGLAAQASVDAGAALDELEDLLSLLRSPDRHLDDTTCTHKLAAYGPAGGGAAAAAAQAAELAAAGEAAGIQGAGGPLARRRLARHYLALAASQLDSLLGEWRGLVGWGA